MFLASKYEEMYAPEIGDFVYITDNAYTKTRVSNVNYFATVAPSVRVFRVSRMYAKWFAYLREMVRVCTRNGSRIFRVTEIREMSFA